MEVKIPFKYHQKHEAVDLMLQQEVSTRLSVAMPFLLLSVCCYTMLVLFLDMDIRTEIFPLSSEQASLSLAGGSSTQDLEGMLELWCVTH